MVLDSGTDSDWLAHGGTGACRTYTGSWYPIESQSFHRDVSKQSDPCGRANGFPEPCTEIHPAAGFVCANNQTQVPPKGYPNRGSRKMKNLVVLEK